MSDFVHTCICALAKVMSMPCSVCPPYLAVSYEELFDLLEGSPLLHDKSVIFVEYPQSAKRTIPGQIRTLPLVRDRKYGRTQLAVYAAL